MYGVMMFPLIDHSNLFCENPNIMIELFGLNAARINIILASMRVLKTNYNHVCTSTDILTMKGHAITFNTAGQNKRIDKSTAIMAVSMDPKNNFINAAIKNIEDPIGNSLSCRLMGQASPIGTNYSKIISLPKNF